MQDKLLYSEKIFRVQWMLASAVGYTAAIPLGFFVAASITTSPVLFNLIDGFIIGTINGVVTGMLQWLPLRQRFSQMNWWIIVSIIGFAGGGLLGEAEFFDRLILEGTARLTMLGILVGTAQWLLLRRHVLKAERWIIANTLGWGMGAVIGTLVSGSIAKILLFPVSGAVAGVITGQTLINMLREIDDSAS